MRNRDEHYIPLKEDNAMTMIKARQTQKIRVHEYGEYDDGLLETFMAIPIGGGNVDLVPMGGRLLRLGPGDKHSKTIYAVVVINPPTPEQGSFFVEDAHKGIQDGPGQMQSVEAIDFEQIPHETLGKLPKGLPGFKEVDEYIALGFRKPMSKPREMVTSGRLDADRPRATGDGTTSVFPPYTGVRQQ